MLIGMTVRASIFNTSIMLEDNRIFVYTVGRGKLQYSPAGEACIVCDLFGNSFTQNSEYQGIRFYTVHGFITIFTAKQYH